MRILPALVAGLAACTGTASADITGRATVVDTIEIHGERVRLFGADAPEGRQICTLDGEPYRCGQRAALALADHLGQRTVRCEGNTRDRYGRAVATCHVGDQDLNAWMVAQGWALAFRRYSTRYVTEEDAARAKRRGFGGVRSIRPGTGGPLADIRH